MLVIALNDFGVQEQFTIFLYTAREYQRRGGIRFLIPSFRKDRKARIWRERLQNAIVQEKLTATTLIDHPTDLHSLIDAADLTIYTIKEPEQEFAFPLTLIQALCAGKPLICQNVSPWNEVMAGFQEKWLVKAYEDFSRISRDFLKQESQLEQISTDLARFSRARMGVDAVADHYSKLYKSVLNH
jgi:glycosyltransferase involved in cell wall biosynthesis